MCEQKQHVIGLLISENYISFCAPMKINMKLYDAKNGGKYDKTYINKILEVVLILWFCEINMGRILFEHNKTNVKYYTS